MTTGSHKGHSSLSHELSDEVIDDYGESQGPLVT